MALEAAYAFDGSGTTVTDLSGNGRDIDLTGTNGVQVAGGQTGNALGKTGATMPTLPAAVLAASQTDDRTIMFDAQGNLTTWWVRFNDTTFASGMWGVLNISGSMAVQARDNTGSHNLATRPAAAAPSAGVWHNYCATYVRSTGLIKLYIDGVLTTPGPPNGQSSFTAGTQLSTSANTIDIAEWSTTGAALDNLRGYSHALTSTEVASIAGTPVTAPTLTDAGTAALALTATGSGVKVATASGAAAMALTAIGAGSKTAADAQTPALALTADGTALAVRSGSITAQLALTADGTGTKTGTDGSTAPLALSAVWLYNAVRSGVAEADLTLTASVAGSAVRAGAETAALALVASGVAAGDIRDITLTITGLDSRWLFTEAPSRWDFREEV